MRLSRARVCCLALLCLASPIVLCSQAGLDIVEKSDYHRYVGQANQGLVYRESRAYLHPAPAGGSRWEGRVLVLEELYKDGRSSAREIDRSLEVNLDASGLPLSQAPGRAFLEMGGGFPRYRGLLADSPAELLPGQTWQAPAQLAIDPANNGDFLVLPVLVEYKVQGPATYGEAQVILVKAKFALRYSGSLAGEVRSAQGSHELDLYVEPSSQGLLFLRDRFDDSFGLASSPGERHSGFCLVFYKGLEGASRSSDLALLSNGPGSSQGPGFSSPPRDPSLSSAGTGPLLGGDDSGFDEGTSPSPSPELARAGVDLLDSPDGPVLRIRDLPFVADKADILPTEAWRLDALAASLLLFPTRSFLVEGHSAATGRPGGELELSLLRAKKVVDELVARGIPASRFVYRGLGSTKPLAPNDSEAGRAKNRRVEITILK